MARLSHLSAVAQVSPSFHESAKPPGVKLLIAIRAQPQYRAWDLLSLHDGLRCDEYKAEIVVGVGRCQIQTDFSHQGTATRLNPNKR